MRQIQFDASGAGDAETLDYPDFDVIAFPADGFEDHIAGRLKEGTRGMSRAVCDSNGLAVVLPCPLCDAGLGPSFGVREHGVCQEMTTFAAKPWIGVAVVFVFCVQ